MALLNRKNFATSLVATAPSPATSGTSLVVTTGEGALFPSAPFYAVICPASTNPTAANAEVVLVTARATDTFTIVRASDGSTARSVIVGDQIFCGPINAYLIDRDTDNNASINNVLEGYATTATAAGTTTLTVASAYQQYFTGSTTQTVVLPDATTLTLGHEFIIINRSTGNVTVNKNGGGLSLVVVPDGIAYFQVTNIGSAAGTWDTTFFPKMGGSGSGIVTFFSGTDTVVGRNTIDALTNKDLSSATNILNPALVADAPNSAIDINVLVGSAATVFTKSVTGIVAGDQIILECYFSILNNSGGTKTYGFQIVIGGVTTTLSFAATIAASATNTTPSRLAACIGISANNKAYIHGSIVSGTAGATGTSTTLTVNYSPQVYNTTTSDLTGTRTVAFKAYSSATGGTAQTLNLVAYNINKTTQKL